jgi:hypothetical protein
MIIVVFSAELGRACMASIFLLRQQKYIPTPTKTKNTTAPTAIPTMGPVVSVTKF